MLGTSTPLVRVPKPSKKKCKAIEEVLVEEALESPLHRDANSIIEEQKLLPPYVQPRTVKAQEVKLPMKERSSLVSL